MDSRVMELRIKKWIPLIEEQARSGMTKDEWCAMHGIERTSFFRWQKRVREYLLAQCEAQSPQLPSSVPSNNNEVGFVELSSTQCSPAGMEEQQRQETIQACGAPSISIRYGGFSIDLNDSVEEKQLSMVLKVLKDVY